MDSQLPSPVTARSSKNRIFSPRSVVEQVKNSFISRPKSPAVGISSLQPSLNQSENPIHHDDGLRFDVTEADILEHVHMHQNFQLPDVEGVELTDLPSFDDFTQYGEIPEEVQKQLWEKEVSRLANIVRGTDALAFKGSESLAVDSKKAHEIFLNLADRFLQVLSIISYDGECLMAEHQPILCQIPVLERSRITLGYICNKDKADDADNDEETPEARIEDVFAFIEYCTAILAGIMCAEAGNKLVVHRILAHIAKITTKAKVLSANLERFSQISIDTGIHDEELSGLKSEQATGDPVNRNQNTTTGADPLGVSQGERTATLAATPGRDGIYAFGRTSKGQNWDSFSKKGALRDLYFAQCGLIRFNILEVLMHLMVRLRGDSRLMRASYVSYEISTIVYETGFERFRTLVFQDRDNKLDGSANPQVVDSARYAFGRLNGIVQHLQENQPQEGDASQSIGAQLTWTYVVEDNVDRDPFVDLQVENRLELKSMSNVIAVLVPLLFTSPSMVLHTQELFSRLSDRRLHLWTNKRSYTTQSRPSRRYAASFCVDTREHRDAQRRFGPEESKSLSNSLIRRNGLMSGRSIAQIGRVQSFAQGLAQPKTSEAYYRAADEFTSYMSRIKKNQAEIEASSKIMKPWVLEEKGVMVQCRLYVSVIMISCALLIVGGIAVGATVGNRIAGVDPFNITTYCWALAAFVVLVAKSVRVHEWSWNDFLRGRVLCKSVSELSSVTGIHAQLIIAYLLQSEQQSFLETRGPFNIVFMRKSDDGFSIDVPLSTWTMLLSGLIMVEVESAYSRGLVCLDLRRGITYNEVNPWKSGVDGDESGDLGCWRLQDQRVDIYTNQPQVRLAYGKGMTWIRTVGLYGNSNVQYI